MNGALHDDTESTESSTSTDDARSSSSTPTSYTDNHSLLLPQSRPSSSSNTASDIESSDILENYGETNHKPTTPGNSYHHQQHHRPTEQEKALIKSAHISNEHARLTNLLQDLPPQRIVSILEKKLRKKDSKTIVAMSILLPRSEFPASEQFHCVRCHQLFRSGDQGNCVLRHPNKAVAKVKEDGGGGTFHCHSCRKSFRLENMYFYNENVNAYMAGYCYSGKHTTNPQFVTHQGDSKTCEEQGCVEFYV